MKVRSLPLGIDIGTARIRVVHAVAEGTRRRVSAVAARDVSSGAIRAEGIAEPDYVAAVLEDVVRELKTPERRCVAAIGLPAATLRRIVLPPMTALERMRTVRFEAARYVDYPIEEATVCMRRLSEDSRNWAVGIVRARTLRARAACLRRAGLRLRAMDDEGCALRRCLPSYDAVLDLGEHRSTLYSTPLLEAWQIRTGGEEISVAIASDLHLDRASAEKRKRILGTAGAGDRKRAELVTGLASLIQKARKSGRCHHLAVVGNAARLPGLLTDLAAASGATCEFAVSHALNGDSYSQETVALGAPDWTLAAALAR